jgi:hypothetical protein
MNSQEIKEKMIKASNQKDVREAAGVSLDMFKVLNNEEHVKYSNQWSFEEKHVQGHDFYFLIFNGKCWQMRCYKDAVEIQHENDSIADSAYNQLKQY